MCIVERRHTICTAILEFSKPRSSTIAFTLTHFNLERMTNISLCLILLVLLCMSRIHCLIKIGFVLIENVIESLGKWEVSILKRKRINNFLRMHRKTLLVSLHCEKLKHIIITCDWNAMCKNDAKKRCWTADIGRAQDDHRRNYRTGSVCVVVVAIAKLHCYLLYYRVLALLFLIPLPRLGIQSDCNRNDQYSRLAIRLMCRHISDIGNKVQTIRGLCTRFTN